MRDVVVKTELVDLLECDTCGDNFVETQLFLICKWDTEIDEYYLSEILCPTHIRPEHMKEK